MASADQPQFLLQGDVYEVEKLVGIKIVNGKKLYRVRWQGYSAQNDTLEPEENLLSCKDMITDLEAKLKQKKIEKQMKIAAQRGEKVIDKYADSSSDSLYKQPGPSGSKDTFWRDFDEGKIDVSDKDMYSKVKERAARAVFQNDGKSSSSDTQLKGDQHLVCPKVVLKRKINPKNANALPTYKSTLQIKQVAIRVKKRKKYDVLRDYRKRRSRNARRHKMDENKIHSQALILENRQKCSLYQIVGKSRNTSSLSKSDGQESPLPTEYSKVLQELPTNDEVGSNGDFPSSSSLSNSNTTSKVSFKENDKEFSSHSSPFKESFCSSSSVNKKELCRMEQRRNSEMMKEPKFFYKLAHSLSSSSSANGYNRNTVVMRNLNIRSTTDAPLSKLSVVSSEQIERWKSFRPRTSMILERVFNMERSAQIEMLSRHGFDMLMACSLHGMCDIVERMCSRGMPLNQSREDGTTAVMILSQIGLHDIVRILLRFNAHKDRQNRYGETALMLACRHRRARLVKLLLEHGANFAITNIDGISALRISNRYATKTDIPNIMNEHISRIKLEFEIQARSAIDKIADIRYALFPIQCFSLSEGPRFSINFSHHVELESPGKSGKAFLLFIANCTIKGTCVRCVFNGVSTVTSVEVNGVKQECFVKGNFVFRMSCLRTGTNEIVISTAQYPQSEVKLIVCGYRVHYKRLSFSHSSDAMLTAPHYH